MTGVAIAASLLEQFVVTTLFDRESYVKTLIAPRPDP